MPEVVVVRGEGGGLLEMTVPTRGHAAEIFAEKVAKGDLVIVTDPVEWVDAGDGARKLALIRKPDDTDALADEQVPTEEPKRRGRPPKTTETPEVPPSEE